MADNFCRLYDNMNDQFPNTVSYNRFVELERTGTG